MSYNLHLGTSAHKILLCHDHYLFIIIKRFYSILQHSSLIPMPLPPRTPPIPTPSFSSNPILIPLPSVSNRPYSLTMPVWYFLFGFIISHTIHLILAYPTLPGVQSPTLHFQSSLFTQHHNHVTLYILWVFTGTWPHLTLCALIFYKCEHRITWYGTAANIESQQVRSWSRGRCWSLRFSLRVISRDFTFDVRYVMIRYGQLSEGGFCFRCPLCDD